MAIVRVVNPTLRFWNYVKLDCRIMVEGSEVFNNEQRLVQIDVTLSDELFTIKEMKEIVKENWAGRPHFKKADTNFYLLQELWTYSDGEDVVKDSGKRFLVRMSWVEAVVQDYYEMDLQRFLSFYTWDDSAYIYDKARKGYYLVS